MKMTIDAPDLKKNIVRSLPNAFALVFGDPITKAVASLDIAIKGYEYFKKLNDDWVNKYVTWLDAIELIDDQLKSAEHIQFIREVFMKVGYETRLEKRQYLLNLAINYHKKNEQASFDKKLIFLNILDNLSEMELLYLLYFYGKLEKNPIDLKEVVKINMKLVGTGLISQDFSKINNALKKIDEQSEKTIKTINDTLRAYENPTPFKPKIDYRSVQKFDPSFDKFEIKYSKSVLGREFIEFITNEEQTKIKSELKTASPDEFF